MKRVLLDVATPKHAILAKTLYTELKRKGYKPNIVAREATQTINILEIMKLPYKIIGGYGHDLKSKLIESIEQMERLLRYFEEEGYPDILWTHGNVPGIRLAYQLDIPIVYMNDTPYNEPVARLTVPLATYLITPEVWRKEDWSRYGLEKRRIIRYKGIEEVAWIKNYKPDQNQIRELVEDSDRIVIMRGREYKASYSYGIKIDLHKIIPKLAKHAKIIYIPRYREEYSELEKYKIKNLIIPRKTYLAADLLAYADLLISAGGTMTNEAALLGTPVIAYHVYPRFLKYLIDKGLPIITENSMDQILVTAMKILRDPDRYKIETKNILEEMENPINIVMKYIKKVG
jgi:hypothetical protein